METNQIEATHNFNPEQQTIILNAVDTMLIGYKTALLLNSALADTYTEYLEMQTKTIEGVITSELSPRRFNRASDAFRTVNELFTEIDTALFHAVPLK
ncbi:MAG: hypothetical protein FD166_2838 [Bacteroidetes bacterium]|nr:MAG: hypothetical protein FD166_2838 [Bacteroidota bacterium]